MGFGTDAAFKSVTVAALGYSMLQQLTAKLAQKKSKIFLDKLLPPDDKIDVSQSLAFQYFPETINDNFSVNYSTKNIPGGSLPIYQWVTGGEHLISFSTIFTTDIDPLTESVDKSDLEKMSLTGRNVDTRAALVWLRSFTQPFYDKKRKKVLPPPKAWLCIPESGIGYAFDTSAIDPDALTCIMKQCDIEYVAFFPTGYPRIVKVNLSFAQTAQDAGTVLFPNMPHDTTKAYIEQGWGIEGGYPLKAY